MTIKNLGNRIRAFFLTPYDSIEEIRFQLLAVFTAFWTLVFAAFQFFLVPKALREGNYFNAIVLMVSFALLLVMTLLGNRVSYRIRSNIFSLIAYSSSLVSLFGTGMTSSSMIWMLYFTIFATIFIGFRSGLISNIVAGATIALMGYAHTTQVIFAGTEAEILYSQDPGNWISDGSIFFFVSISLTIFTGLIIRGMERSRDTLAESFQETQELTARLEVEQDALARQTVDLEKRLTQIRTAAEISRTLGSILDPQELLQKVVDLIKERFDLYYVGVFQVDENRRFAQLVAGTGEAGQAMLNQNHQLAVGGASMVGWAVSHSEPRISLDVGTEAVRFQNPNLPETRSELALPIRIGAQTTGAISVQSTEPDAFDEADITILQGIADSLAIALENASLFQQFESSLREIQQLNRQYVSESWQNVWAEGGKDLIAEKGQAGQDEHLNEVNIPLRLRGEQIIGNITLATEQADLSEDDREFVEAVSNQAAIALESARLLDEANRRVEQERALQGMTNRFSRSLDFESLLKTIVEEIGQIPMVKETAIHVTPPDILQRDDDTN